MEIYRETENGVESVCAYEQDLGTVATSYKAYYIDRENQLIGLGIIDYSMDFLIDKPSPDTVNSRYILLHFDGNNLVEVLNVELQGDNDLKRGVYIDGYMYLFGENNFLVEKI